MMKTLVIATDGSAHADKALDVAAALAGKFGSKIVVVHVLMRGASFSSIYEAFKTQGLPTDVLDELPQPMPAVYGFVGPVTPVVSVLELATLGQRILDRAKATLEKSGIRGATFSMEDGDPPRAILDVAKRENADAIIMGHRGLGVLQEVIAGSVSTKIGHLAPCTVITVK